MGTSQSIAITGYSGGASTAAFHAAPAAPPVGSADAVTVGTTAIPTPTARATATTPGRNAHRRTITTNPREILR
nr:hypothetical protein GCM10017611_30060 [Rhodococcus wratislaviensis]